jgi:hypothetical protein
MTQKNIIFWDLMPCSLVEFTHISEEIIASVFRVNN